MMRRDGRTRQFGRLLQVLLAAFVAAACAPPEPARLSAACPEAAVPLWEVTSGESTVYLMGSVHMLRPDVYPLNDALYDAFDQAEVVAFELDFGEMEAAAPQMMARGMYPAGRSLRDDIPADLYDELESRFAAFGLPPVMVERLRPWMASLMLSQLAIQAGGYEAEAGVDMHFFERAREAGTPVVGLETVDEQITVFEGLSTEAQAAFLRSTVEEIDETVEQLDAVTEMWRRGEVEGLAELMTEEMTEHPVLQERLLYDRNRNWIPRIEAFLAGDETAVVVVGLGHLAGEQSVVDLLRRQGHTVERVVGTCP